ncbi:MAG: ferredoxin [Candidatus Aenigmatarchaeota archaeon]
MVKIRVNEKCIGCGACVAIAPEIFEFNKDGFSVAKISETNDKKLVEKAKEAAEACPTGAIEIKE